MRTFEGTYDFLEEPALTLAANVVGQIARRHVETAGKRTVVLVHFHAHLHPF